MPPLSNIQSIITYFQNYPPDGLVSTGDIWYNPDSREAFIYIDEVWHNVEITPITPGHMYGYSIGGRVTSVATSLVDRIEFPFDAGTSVDVGEISEGLEKSASCNSSNYGFVMGGDSVSHIQRFDFPFSAGTATNNGTLTDEKYSSAGFSDTHFGFNVGGTVGGSPSVDEVEKFEFPFDTGEALVVSQLDDDSRLAMGACASSRHGYIMGGTDESATAVDYIDRFTFPFDAGSLEQTSANLSAARDFNAGCESKTHGYSIGGIESGPTYVKTVDRFTFALDTSAASVGELNVTRHSLAAFNSTRYAYAAGGRRNATIGLNSIDRFEFPFSSGTATTVGNLNSTRVNNVGLDGTQFWF